MPQWKSAANAAGMPKWSASILQQGSGAAAKAANNLALIANVSPGVFKAHGIATKNVLGIFPVTGRAKANTSGESAKVHGLGWALRTQGEGQITAITANVGSGFLTGDTVTVSNGQGINSYAIITANVTGNIASIAVPVGGQAFVNIADPYILFNRERHVITLNVANGVGVTYANGVGNANTINVTVSNTGNSFAIGAGVIATGSFTSNSTSGFQNTDMATANMWSLGHGANAAFGGQFSNNQTNTAVVVTFTNANGMPVGIAGGSLTVSANLAPSVGGAAGAKTLGGRAGRVTYEVLTIDRHIVNGASGTVANSIYLPET